MKKFDYAIFTISLFLSILGILEVYSVSGNYGFLKTQLIAFFIGIILFFIIYLFLPVKFFKKTSFFLYFLTILLLIYTLKRGILLRGTKAWINIFGYTFQSSEFAKFSLILFLSYFIDRKVKNIGGVRLFFPILVISIIPSILISIEPDLGTSMFFPFVFIGYIFLTGIPFVFFVFFLVFVFSFSFSFILNILKNIPILTNLYLLFLGIIVIILLYLLFKRFIYFPRGMNVFILFLSLFYSLGIISGFVADKTLKKYQKKRIVSFISPSNTSVGSSYQRRQAKIAFGSGRIFGKGFKKGTQTKLGFLPQATTDFMFSTIGEEFGFLGSLIVVLGYLFLILRCIKISIYASQPFTSYFSAGAAFYFLFHFFINVGMNLGFIPIAGIPLPFVSKGGSSLIVSFLILGIIERIVKDRWNY